MHAYRLKNSQVVFKKHENYFVRVTSFQVKTGQNIQVRISHIINSQHGFDMRHGKRSAYRRGSRENPDRFTDNRAPKAQESRGVRRHAPLQNFFNFNCLKFPLLASGVNRTIYLQVAFFLDGALQTYELFHQSQCPCCNERVTKESIKKGKTIFAIQLAVYIYQKYIQFRFIYLFVLYSETSDRFPENGGNRYGSAPGLPRAAIVLSCAFPRAVLRM